MGILWKQLWSRTLNNLLWLLDSVIYQSHATVIEAEAAQPLELHKTIGVNVFEQRRRVWSKFCALSEVIPSCSRRLPADTHVFNRYHSLFSITFVGGCSTVHPSVEISSKKCRANVANPFELAVQVHEVICSSEVIHRKPLTTEHVLHVKPEAK